MQYAKVYTSKYVRSHRYNKIQGNTRVFKAKATAKTIELEHFITIK